MIPRPFGPRAYNSAAGQNLLLHALNTKISIWYEISGLKKKMPRRLLKVEVKRLILTCYETFIEANGKQLTKMNIANKVNSVPGNNFSTYVISDHRIKQTFLVVSNISIFFNNYQRIIAGKKSGTSTSLS
jgi:hypothetical protein